MRSVLYEQLHLAYEPRAFDNWLVWAGNMAILLDGERCDPTLARAFVGPQKPAVEARVQVELFVAAVEAAQVRSGDVRVRLWTDVNQRGSVDEEGVYQNDPGRYLPMHLVCGRDGVPRLAGNNLVFESDDFSVHAIGVFGFAVELSAAPGAADQPGREWININDMAPNQDGVLVVSPGWVLQGPSIVEACVRKAGAHCRGGAFHSGTFARLQRDLEQLQADIVYLLPFFKPGFSDLHSGKDVRKGSLGSVYAVIDFFQLDPELISAPEDVNLQALVEEGLLQDGDVRDLGLGGLRTCRSCPWRRLSRPAGAMPWCR